MASIGHEIERTARDITVAPSFRDSAEIAIAGGLFAAAVGYLKTRNRSEAMRYAWYGAGLSVGAQYLVFHMLKPAMKEFARAGSRASLPMPPHFMPMPHPYFHPGVMP